MAKPMSNPPSVRPSASSSELVAIVDDDPTARRLMRYWLESSGYRTLEHSTGRSVIEDHGEVPAVACIDLGLGEVTGMKVIQHLKARDADLPMIVVTAQREIETAVSAM